MTSDVFDCKVPNAIPQEGHGLIYLYTFDNGMMYVGQTIRTLRERHTGHKDSRQVVDNYVRTHDYRLDVLGFFTKQELDEQERFFIKELNTLYPNGLNFDTGGNALKEFPPERLEQMSKVMLEVWKDPEYRKKCSDSHKGKTLSPEQRKKIRDFNRGRVTSEETKKKLSESKKGKLQTEDRRKLQSEVLKKAWADPEKAARMSAGRKGRKVKDETKKKMSITSKQNWEKPEYREKIASFQKTLQNDPEHKKKMSAIMKEKWKDPEYRAKVKKGTTGKKRSPEVGAKISKSLREYHDKKKEIT